MRLETRVSIREDSSEEDDEDRSLSRPSSVSSQASSFLGEEDLQRRQQKMQQLLDEKAAQKEKKKDRAGESPRSKKGQGGGGGRDPSEVSETRTNATLQRAYTSSTGRAGRTADPLEKQSHADPFKNEAVPNVTEIIRKRRQRRLGVLMIIFVGFCILPFPVHTYFEEDIQP